jgi:hypothetical protein
MTKTIKPYHAITMQIPKDDPARWDNWTSEGLHQYDLDLIVRHVERANPDKTRERLKAHIVYWITETDAHILVPAYGIEYFQDVYDNRDR